MVVSETSAARGGAPERSIVQRMEALHRANVIREWRAERKRDLKAGRARVTDMLLDVDPRMETMKVYALLLAVPKVGRVKADRVLRRNAISPSKTVGGLSDRQRTELVAALLPYAVRSARRMDE
jgi:hypothetical protein